MNLKISKEDEIDDFIKEKEGINEILENMEFEFREKLSKLKLQNATLEDASKCENNVKLPKLTLPIFTGILYEWIFLRTYLWPLYIKIEICLKAINLQYLKSSLTGDAFWIIQSISIVDSNNEVTLSLLKELFSNTKKKQVYTHLKHFF